MKNTADLVRRLATESSTRFDFWEAFLKATQVSNMAEIGVWKGEFAQSMLESCASIQRYYMLDPWARLPDWRKPANVSMSEFEKIYEEAMSRTAFASHKRTVLRGRTSEVANGIPDQSLDFVYIDGDHTLRGIMIDLIQIFPKIRIEGWIGGDDFIAYPWHHGVECEPTMVCPLAVHFAEAMDVPIYVLPHAQFLIQKRSDARFSFVDLTGHFSDISLGALFRNRTILSRAGAFMNSALQKAMHKRSRRSV